MVVRAAGVDQPDRAILRIPKGLGSHRPAGVPIPKQLHSDAPIDRPAARLACRARAPGRIDRRLNSRAHSPVFAGAFACAATPGNTRRTHAPRFSARRRDVLRRRA
ncbi:hypothetical protein AQ477_21820 [Burkholderia thailandensis]|nr:hypothetical protein AQ477_21820 [Burkholderia thailandensis]KXF58330.1 hypothetical protein AQ476_26935 [Burkholderia thailandensis]PNE76909.1 hypothetical protein A8H37_00260 [Burkholderia thailandensis]